MKCRSDAAQRGPPVSLRARTPPELCVKRGRPSFLQARSAIITDVSRAPRARIEAHGDPRRMRGERAGAAQ
jgi:hypothetical protein